MFKFLVIIGLIFFTIFLIGFISAAVVSLKKNNSNYPGPTTSSGVIFWFVSKISQVIYRKNK